MTLSKIIKHVMTSPSEAEVATLLYNYRAAEPLKIALEEMGHRQPSKTPVITDNKTLRYDTAFLAILTPQLQTSITCQCH